MHWPTIDLTSIVVTATKPFVWPPNFENVTTMLSCRICAGVTAAIIGGVK